MIWKQYGLGTALNGYLKINNPSDFDEVMKEVYVRHESAIFMRSLIKARNLLGSIVLNKKGSFQLMNRWG
ncbi:hypothetical protein [Bacillus haynesii]|uniref:hypothetical protein n=1 Tax=Bacillus haynesii TaxID=1925021 RepID=UPI00398B77DD